MMLRVSDWRLVVGGALLCGFLLIAVAPQAVTRQNPFNGDLGGALGLPSHRHLFGTDELGRDLFARVVYGARITLEITVGALLVSAVAGVALGTAAGYRRGPVDEAVMRTLDIVMSFPGVLLAIAIVAGLGRGIVNLSIAMGVTSVPVFARLSRGLVLSVAENEYVAAATAMGSTGTRIVVRHIVPNIMSTILVQLVARFGLTVLSAASLGFLGLGVEPPQPEWGQLINAGRAYIGSNPGLIVFPGVALMATVFAFNLVGDFLQDLIDPRLRR